MTEPTEDTVAALEGARRYLREQLDGEAEWKDAAALVPLLAAALVEAVPAAVAASTVLPAAAATRAYWQALDAREDPAAFGDPLGEL